MAKDTVATLGENYGKLVEGLPYILAGLEGLTNGHKLNSITVQQAGLSGYRIILRGTGDFNGESSVHVVGFTAASDPATAILLAEEGYRDNVIRWSVDRFAKSISDSKSSKNGNDGLTITS